MANNLGRTIEEGEAVILLESVMATSYKGFKFRIFICDGGGFGAKDFTAGTALFGKFAADGEVARVEGTDIDRDATISFQERYGKNGKDWPEGRDDATPEASAG